MHKLKIFAAALVAAAGLALPAQAGFVDRWEVLDRWERAEQAASDSYLFRSGGPLTRAALRKLATVSTTCVSQSSTGNNVTVDFPFPCKFLKTTDLVVTVNGVTQTITTHYTVTGAGTGSSGNVHFLTAPAAVAVVITRVTEKTQGTSLRGSRTYDAGTVEDAIDRTVLIEQELNAGIAVSQNLTDASGATATISGGTTSATLAARWGDLPNVRRDFGALADGTSDDHLAFSSMISAKTGVLFVPASSFCYNLGATGITLAAGRILQGAGMGGASSGPTCLKYTGTGCAITIDSVSFAGVRDLDVQVDTTSATARGICVKSTSNVAEFNTVESVSIRMVNATRRTAGQIALYLNDPVGHGVFWNTFKKLVIAFWDTSVKTDGVLTNGVNANHFEDLVTWGHLVGMRMIGHSDDNFVFNLFCSRSDNSYEATSNTCVQLGDDGSAVFANRIHFTNDAANNGGVNTVCGTIGVASGGNMLYADCESGGPVADSYTGAFKSEIHEPVSSGKVTFGKLITTGDATIIGTTFTGIAGTGGSAGGAVAINGGIGDANQTGGNLVLRSGAGGAGTASPGRVILTPGNRAGAANGGSVVIGGPPTTGAAGLRVQSSRVIIANKPVATADCGGAAMNPTVSTVLDGSFFTCGTNQTLTLPTAQGASGIVQGLPDQPVVVGDVFWFVTSSTAAANFTIAAGAGGTIVGNAVVSNGQHVWLCKVTSIGAGTETISCY